jgi:hypothetical protein
MIKYCVCSDDGLAARFNGYVSFAYAFPTSVCSSRFGFQLVRYAIDDSYILAEFPYDVIV